MIHIVQCDDPSLLPFARSRLGVLRGLGLAHISQKYDVGGVTVRVQKSGEHEYIWVSGAPIEPLCGVTRVGEWVTIEPTNEGDPPRYSAHEFMPTEETRYIASVKTDKELPATFNDEPALYITIHPDLAAPVPVPDGVPDPFAKFVLTHGAPLEGPPVTDLQIKHISPSMYSGLMAKAVQILLGYGKRPIGGNPQISYDSRWLKCNGIVTAADGKLWLVEISAARGVIAMPFPVSKRPPRRGSYVCDEAVRLFGGMPTGANFPDGEEFDSEVAKGNILEVASAATMLEIYEKDTYSSALGWSFNDTGSEAHNTCYYSPDYPFLHARMHAYDVFSYHYVLEIVIGETVAADAREPNQPLASCSMNLITAEIGWLTKIASSVYAVSDEIPFAFYEPLIGALAPTPARTYGMGSPPSTPFGLTTSEPTVFVCHVDNVLEEAWVQYENSADVDSTTYAAETLAGIDSSGTVEEGFGSRQIICTSYPEERNRSYSSSDVTHAVFFTRSFYGRGATHWVYRTATNVGSQRVVGSSGAVWAEGSRDCFVLHHEMETEYAFTTYQRISQRIVDVYPSYNDGDPPYSLVAVPNPPGNNDWGLTGSSLTATTYATAGDRSAAVAAATSDTGTYPTPPGLPPAEPTTLSGVYLRESAKCIIVGAGVEHAGAYATVPASTTDFYDYGPTYDAVLAGEYQSAWYSPADLGEPARGFTVRKSMAGEGKQVAFSGNLEPWASEDDRGTLRLSGQQLGAEAPDSVADGTERNYSFVGAQKPEAVP